MLSEQDCTRKSTYLAHKGEWGSAWRTHQASPSAKPTDDARRALIGFNNQTPRRTLTPAHVANEPGKALIQFKPTLVDRAVRRLRDIKAAGTLPEDNRIIKMIVAHGGLHHVTKWINAACRDELHPSFAELIAGAVRAGLLQKIDTVTAVFKGFRPLGIIEKCGDA